MKPRYDSDRAIRELCPNDPKLAQRIKPLGPFDLQIHRTGDIYASLIRSIIYQQLHGQAAAKIHAHVLALVGSPPAPATVDSVDDHPLRAAGLSRAKLAAIRDLTTKSVAGIVPNLAQARRLPDDTLIERLTSVGGV